MERMEQKEASALAGIIMFGFAIWIAAQLTGCSFKVEMGYHGQTGRDDRVQTELLNADKRRAERKDY